MLRALVKLLVWSSATSLEIIPCFGEEGQTGIMVTFGEMQGAGSWEMAVWKKQPAPCHTRKDKGTSWGDFFHLALRVENQGQLFSSHPSELGHRTNHAMHKDVMSTIIVFRRLRQGALEFKPT